MKLDEIKALCGAAEADGTDLGCKPRLMRKLVAVAEAARPFTDCQHPVHDVEGDGEWAMMIDRPCGECEACELAYALDELEAP